MIADKVRLEVAGDPPAGQVVNLVPNPDGDLGGYGWLTQLSGAYIQPTPGVAHELRYVSAVGANRFSTILLPTTPGKWLANRFTTTFVRGFLRHTLDFYDTNRALLSSGPTSSYYGSDTLVVRPTVQVPTGAVYVRARFDHYADTAGTNPAANRVARFTQVQIAEVANSTITNPPYTEARYWVDITASVTQIDLTRAELDAGSIGVTLRSNALNPATNTLLKSGRRVRLSALGERGWDAIAGELVMSRPMAIVDPRLLAAGSPKATTITFTAEDAAARLAAYTRTAGVFDQQDIPSLLEAYDVPWNVNGNTQQVASVPVARTFVAASGTTLLDHITRIRNSYYSTVPSVPIYVNAWVDRYGVLQVWGTAYTDAIRTNVVPDTSFGDPRGIEYWQRFSNVTLAYLSADATYGNALRATADAAGIGYWRSTPAPVTPGAELSVSYTVRLGVAGRRVTTSAVYFNAAGLEISRDVLSNTTLFTTTSYLGYTDQRTVVPPGAVTMALLLTAENLALGEQIYMSKGYVYAINQVVLGDGDLSDAPTGWGDDQNFNTVTVDSLFTGTDGKAAQATFGPFTDAASIAAFGPRPVTVAVCGFSSATGTDLTALQNYLLARNATPRQGVTEVRIPIRSQAEITRHGFRDVCDRVRVTGQVTDDGLRVTSVTHTIRPTNEGGTWLQTLTLAPLDRIGV